MLNTNNGCSLTTLFTDFCMRGRKLARKQGTKAYRRHFNAAIIKVAPSMAETSATTTSIGIHVFSVLGSVKEYKKDISKGEP